MDWATVLACLAALFAAAYAYSAYSLGYWARRGVPHPPAKHFFGHLESVFPSSANFKVLLNKARKMRDQGIGYCGLYMFTRPLIVVWDPEMVKQIMCKDFTSFQDRPNTGSESDPLSAHLFNMNGAKWRNLRNKLTPAFTSGKLKLMFPLIRDKGDILSSVLTEQIEKSGQEVDVLYFISRFAADVIGSCAFGIESNCLHNENKEFMEMAHRALRPNSLQLVRFFLETIHPKLGMLMPFKWIMPNVHRFFLELMRETVEHREKTGLVRPDFVHLMMQLRDEDLGQSDPEHHVDLRDPGMMAAQGFIFFVAGLDNVANTVGFALNRLTNDAYLQDRVAAEVRDVLAEHNGELTYDALKQMDLVNRVVLEALRVWAPIGFHMRQCTATTKVGDVLVKKGDSIFIFAEDDTLFPEGKRFDPDLHTAEANSKRHAYSFLPFGEGPRICIAERFAMLEMKAAVAMMVRDFRMTPGPRFESEVVLDDRVFLPRPKNGFPICLESRNSSKII